jgi:mercuric ion transport protein
VTLGASGAWIGNLTALKEYQPLFVIVTLAFLCLGFWQVYGKRKPTCDDGACETRLSSTLVMTALWVATVLVALAITVNVWAPLFY